MERNDKSILISIVTISLNNLAGIKKTHRSIAGQSYSNYEWIVVDGASSDGTIEFLKTLADPRVFVRSENDTGLYNAMNKGLYRCAGELVIFMNGGDEFAADDVIEKTVEIYTSRPADVLYGDALEETDNGIVYKKGLPSRAIYYSMITHHQAIFYRIGALDGLCYDESFRISGDRAFTATLYRRKRNFLKMNFAVCVFEMGGRSQAGDVKSRRNHVKERMRVLTEVLGMRTYQARSILALKLASEWVRRTFPRLYSILRFSSLR